MLGKLAALGYGPGRIAPVAFHVDYFDAPWKDRFSDPRFSRREYQYSRLYTRANKVKDPNYLYFTPMLMVDGRVPMLGTDEPRARRALQEAVERPPGVRIDLALAPGSGADRKTLKVRLSRPIAEVSGKEVLVGVATVEEPVTTEVASGENAGKTLVEHHAARRLAVEAARPRRDRPVELEFNLQREPGWPAERLSLVVFAQDEATGKIHQAATIRWAGPPAPK